MCAPKIYNFDSCSFGWVPGLLYPEELGKRSISPLSEKRIATQLSLMTLQIVVVVVLVFPKVLFLRSAHITLVNKID